MKRINTTDAYLSWSDVAIVASYNEINITMSSVVVFPSPLAQSFHSLDFHGYCMHTIEMCTVVCDNLHVCRTESCIFKPIVLHM